MLGAVSLNPGDAFSTGYMTFEVPEEATIRTVQYVSGPYGFAAATGVAEWQLPPGWASLKASVPGHPPELGVGDSATLTRDGETIRVTLLGAVDPAGPVASGTSGRLVAFRFLIEHVGNVVYEGRRWRVQVVDASYWPYPHLFYKGSGIRNFTILPGDARSGLVTFEVPKVAAISAVRFTTGFLGNDYAEWRLPPRALVGRPCP